MVKVLADPHSRLLLGAHIIGPDKSILIQPQIRAMCLANTVGEILTGVLYIHPALTEVVEQAVLDLYRHEATARSARSRGSSRDAGRNRALVGFRPHNRRSRSPHGC